MKTASFWPLILLLAFASCQRSPSDTIVQQTYLHKYGAEISQQEWLRQGRTGQIVSLNRSGMSTTRSYSEGILDGTSSQTFPYSDTVQNERHYEKGSLLWEKTYFTSGMPQRLEQYSDSGTTLVTQWYPEGTPKSVEEFLESKLMHGQYYTRDHTLESSVVDGKGERVRRDTYGNILSRDTIKGGMLTLRATYYSNGDPEAIIPYFDGKVSGTKRTYLIGGAPSTVEEWSGGQLNGISISFHNGQKQKEIPYVAGKREGIERRYHNGDQLVEEITWLRDARHGPTHQYYGNHTKTDWYHHGELVSEYSYEELNRSTT